MPPLALVLATADPIAVVVGSGVCGALLILLAWWVVNRQMPDQKAERKELLSKIDEKTALMLSIIQTKNKEHLEHVQRLNDQFQDKYAQQEREHRERIDAMNKEHERKASAQMTAFKQMLIDAAEKSTKGMIGSMAEYAKAFGELTAEIRNRFIDRRNKDIGPPPGYNDRRSQ